MTEVAAVDFPAQDPGAPLTVAVLTEAGPGPGLGHLRRCQALASALTGRGATVHILVDGEADSDAALRLGWTRDPDQAAVTLATLRPDVVVADSYRIGPDFLSTLGGLAGSVVVIDDLAGQPLPVDIVVNGAVHAPTLRYRGRPETRFLLGPDYLLLATGFAGLPDRQTTARVRRVLVTLGGGHAGEAATLVLSAVRRAAPAAAVDLAVGPYAVARADTPPGVMVHRGLHCLRDLILRADLAITAGGMTLYECLAAGTPVVGLCLADNQRGNIDELSRAGIIFRGEPSVDDALRLAVDDATLRARHAAAGRRLVDGRGATRVAEAIAQASRVARTLGGPR